jgi:arabinan endo-1,5-alpha-L-arabinosidase
MRVSCLSLLVGLLAATSAVAEAGQGSTPAPAVCTPAPVLDNDFPDPGVFRDPASGGEVFVYGTNTGAPDSGASLNVPFIRSDDPALARWTPMSEALPRLPGWARPASTWAPAIAHRPGGPYRLYFTARYGYSGRQCIGVAVSASPSGPFTPTDEVKPLVCPLAQGGAIDSSVFRQDDGSEYLLWKTDANCCEGVPVIYIQPLAPDGLSLVGDHMADAPWLLPDAVPLIRRDQAWEGLVVEAPTLLKHAGRYYLFYSGGFYGGGDYAVGYASALSLLGPYQKAAAPILGASTVGLSGPGGQDIFTGPDGADWIAFHAWREVGGRRYRALYLGRIDWSAGGPSVRIACAPPDVPY